jgi:hypothetical protein
MIEKKSSLISRIANRTKKYAKFLVGAVILSLVVFSIIVFNTNIKDNSNRIEKIEKAKKTVDTDGIILLNKIKQLENNIVLIRSNISVLESELVKLQNQDPVNNEKNVQIIILLNKVLNTIYRGGDFSDNIKYLKELSKNRYSIFENIVKLELFKIQQNQKELKSVFMNEYKNMSEVSNDEKNKIKQFFGDNIKIRKIGKIEEEDSKDNIILAIENSINDFEYEKAIEIIKNNNYSIFFSETLKILTYKNEAITIINNTMELIFIN